MSSSSSPSASPPPDLQKKRKKIEQEGDELEIDVNLPEPPSKKAKRKEQKAAKRAKKDKSTGEPTEGDGEAGTPDGVASVHKDRLSQVDASAPKDGKQDDASKPGKRSDYGIWVGNLAFSTTRDILRTFLREQGGISDGDIVRVHMPAPPENKAGGNSSSFRGPAVKPQNKGFAYVDFATQAALELALALSEKLLGGRRLLIKNAKSFEGRPDKSKTEGAVGGGAASSTATIGGKEPTTRVFVGNLSFDVTKDDLSTHFAQAGEVADVHMATFEDSGKCKGYAWVTFADVEAAKAAVLGFVYKAQDEDEDDEEVASEEEAADPDDDSDDEAKKGKSGKKGKAKKNKKKKKPMKWFINRLLGRPLRCEFAEDPQTRYKKRFGSGAVKDSGENGRAGNDGAVDEGAGVVADASTLDRKQGKKLSKDERQDERRKRHEARTASKNTPQVESGKATGAAVAGTGKKITFD